MCARANCYIVPCALPGQLVDSVISKTLDQEGGLNILKRAGKSHFALAIMVVLWSAAISHTSLFETRCFRPLCRSKIHLQGPLLNEILGPESPEIAYRLVTRNFSQHKRFIPFLRRLINENLSSHQSKSFLLLGLAIWEGSFGTSFILFHRAFGGSRAWIFFFHSIEVEVTSFRKEPEVGVFGHDNRIMNVWHVLGILPRVSKLGGKSDTKPEAYKGAYMPTNIMPANTRESPFART